jgi:hypothetical protein
VVAARTAVVVPEHNVAAQATEQRSTATVIVPDVDAADRALAKVTLTLLVLVSVVKRCVLVPISSPDTVITYDADTVAAVSVPVVTDRELVNAAETPGPSALPTSTAPARSGTTRGAGTAFTA